MNDAIMAVDFMNDARAELVLTAFESIHLHLVLSVAADKPIALKRKKISLSTNS